jgi:hypothetical protein
MTSLLDLGDEFIGPLKLTWNLDNQSRRRVIQASGLPAIVIVALIVRAFLEYSYGPGDLQGAPELVQGLYRAVIGVDILTPAAVALLFLSGLRQWSREQGSWMLLIGGLLATIAIAFGALVTLVYTAGADFDTLYDLRVFTLWPDIVDTFALLAVGFFFIAYRGLSAPAADVTPSNREPKTHN